MNYIYIYIYNRDFCLSCDPPFIVNTSNIAQDYVISRDICLCEPLRWDDNFSSQLLVDCLKVINNQTVIFKKLFYNYVGMYTHLN